MILPKQKVKQCINYGITSAFFGFFAGEILLKLLLDAVFNFMKDDLTPIQMDIWHIQISNYLFFISSIMFIVLFWLFGVSLALVSNKGK